MTKFEKARQELWKELNMVMCPCGEQGYKEMLNSIERGIEDVPSDEVVAELIEAFSDDTMIVLDTRWPNDKMPVMMAIANGMAGSEVDCEIFANAEHRSYMSEKYINVGNWASEIWVKYFGL